MFCRKLLIAPLVAVVMLVVGSQAVAAKPILTELIPITLPNIAADGKIDLGSEGTAAVALVEVRYKRGVIVVEVESEGDVLNLSNKRFKTNDSTDFEFFFGPEVTVTKFDYVVSKSGKAVLRLTAVDNMLAPPEI